MTPVRLDKETCLVQSQKWLFGFGLSSELMVSEKEDRGFWDGEDKDFSYPLGELPPNTFLDWAKLGYRCEGIKDTFEDFSQKVKGRRELSEFRMLHQL
jgi:hypothetical protein